MNRRLSIAALALLACSALPPPSVAQTGSWAAWWDEEWHFRVPVTIGPALVQGDLPSDWSAPYPVVYELDVTRALLDAGWPPDEAGRGPANFLLEEDSFRIVPYTGLGPDGRPSGDPVPFLQFKGPFRSLRGAFPEGHTVVTLVWLVRPPLPQTFMVYFDRTTAGDKAPLAVSAKDADAVRGRFYAPGPGHVVQGLVAAGIQNAGVPREVRGAIEILGTSATPTRATVYALDPGGAYTRVAGCGSGGTVVVSRAPNTCCLLYTSPSPRD